MNPTAPVVRIAHAYGNNRTSLARALAADCDMIEVDMWYRNGEFYIRHERRLGPLPVLYDRVMRGHPPGPYAIRIWRYFARPDVGTLRLDELLDAAIGHKRLLLDVKGRYDAASIDRYVKTLTRKVHERKAEEWVAVCGQTYPVLNALRTHAPDLEVRYSLEKPYQWESFLRKMKRDPNVNKVCIAYGFIDAEKAQYMEENNVDLYCWTVDDWAAAERLVGQGVDGIISNDLLLLGTLRDWAPAPETTPNS